MLSVFKQMQLLQSSFFDEGVFAAQPLVGDALITNFQLTASDWLDEEDHMPLKYRFGYIDDRSREVDLVTSYTTRLQLTLPPGILKIGIVYTIHVPLLFMSSLLTDFGVEFCFPAFLSSFAVQKIDITPRFSKMKFYDRFFH